MDASRKNESNRNKIIAISCAVAVLLIVLGVAKFGSSNQSVYQTLVRNGYTGTQEQWIASLVGEEVGADETQTSYELAIANGYKCSEKEWIKTLTGVSLDDIHASPYKIACQNGFEGSLSEWLTSIADSPERLGISDNPERKTEYELACEFGYVGSFIEWLISVTHDRVFE